MGAKKPPVPVRVGQIWADTYYGNKGRTVRVVEMDGARATVEVVACAASAWTDTIGRRSRVLYGDRGLRGYRLDRDAEATPTPDDRGADDRAWLAHVATLRRVKLTLNEEEIWALYRLAATEMTTTTPCLLLEPHAEHERAMGTALAKLSVAHTDLNAPKAGDI